MASFRLADFGADIQHAQARLVVADHLIDLDDRSRVGDRARIPIEVICEIEISVDGPRLA